LYLYLEVFRFGNSVKIVYEDIMGLFY
jgi:hypothetical protein